MMPLSSLFANVFTRALPGALTLLSALVALPAIAGQASPDDPHKNPVRVQYLHAGPVNVKFQDGELRYLTVGDKEIFRRIYFAVRDGNWNTAMPKFTHYEVKSGRDSFTISLEAQCQSTTGTYYADYHWNAKIVGNPDGSINFTATGAPNRDFKSNRIGICVLYGTGSLAEQKFTTFDGKGTPILNPGQFPALVSPKLVGEKFQALRYVTPAGLEVKADMVGATFDMEDQRNWGDTSYKAYAPLPYDYTNAVKKGDSKTQTLTVTLHNVPKKLATLPTSYHVAFGIDLPGVKLPQIGTSAEGVAEYNFSELNMGREKQEMEKVRTWGVNPSVHLPDEDNMTENLPTVVAQAATVKEFAPGVPLHVSPIRIRGLYADGKRDVRNSGPFAVAWAASLAKYLALGGVDHADFDMGPGPATLLLSDMKQYGGKPVLGAKVTGPAKPLAVDAFGVQSADGPVFWVINLTGKTQTVTCDLLPNKPAFKVSQIRAGSKPALISVGEMNPENGKLTLTLAPYQVLKLQ